VLKSTVTTSLHADGYASAPPSGAATASRPVGAIISDVVVGLYSSLGRVWQGVCQIWGWLVGWEGMEQTVKLLVSGKGFDTVDAEHVAKCPKLHRDESSRDIVDQKYTPYAC
jgi:hypothetical protein